MAALDGYELANDSIKRFRAEFPSGRIIPVLLDWDLIKGYVLYRCDVYREYEDVYPSASSTAYGNVEFYPPHMKRWFIEDTETSAITRAIKLLTPSAERPSRATKAASEGISTMATAIAEIQQGLGGELPGEPPRCVHGTRVWAEGKSSKTGKDWAAWRCTQNNKNTQCDPIWQVLGSDGKWKDQV